MQDDNNGQVSDQGGGQDNNQAQNNDQTTSQGDTTTDKGATQNQEGEKSDTQAQKTESGEEKQKPPVQSTEDENPPVRKTKLDYILERKNKQIEKLKQKQTSQKDVQVDNKDEGQNAEEDEITPEEEAKIAKVIEKRYGKKLETVEALADNTEEVSLKTDIQTFLSSDKGKYFKEFESKILTYAKHPSRANIPIEAIAYEVAGPRLLELGAKMAEDARKEALESKGSGGNVIRQNQSTRPDINKMNDAEFEAYKNEIKSKERD